jgi:alpha-mannosidase
MRAPVMRPALNEIIGLGPFDFSYAVLPHDGDWRTVDAPRRGYEFNNDLLALAVGDGFDPDGVWRDWWDGLDTADAVDVPLHFVSTSAGTAIVTAIKQAEDRRGLILRIVETAGRAASAELRFPVALASATICDMLERPTTHPDAAVEEAATPVVNGSTVCVDLQPWEIMTLRVHRS